MTIRNLEDELKALHNVHVLAREEKGGIVFLHKVEDGPTDRSYGIHVARLAKLPAAVVARADAILLELEKNHGTNVIRPQDTTLFNFEAAETAAETIPSSYDPIVEQLKALDVNELTPIKAMNILADVVAELNRKLGKTLVAYGSAAERRSVPLGNHGSGHLCQYTEPARYPGGFAGRL